MLALGTRLGPYEIASLVGSGGMGDVYAATDTNLKRVVALKVLPDALTTDHDRLARFQREAEVLASLNHPHIAQIHGIEKSDGTTALVLEFVDGATLADRIAAGSIPVDEALPIARQIADALETAHEQGIVHRDLKPANVKLRLDGQVKVLDFGLAKLTTKEVATAGSPGLSQSPTLTLHATHFGVILGTAAYMSPEQAKGKAVDRRADIWAFGVVLCEMLTGRQMYDAETVPETLARILERQPDLTGLPATTPPVVRALLERCLTKDPRRRLQSIGEARIALEQAMKEPLAAVGLAARPLHKDPSRWSAPIAWTLTAILAVALAAVLVLWPPWKQPAAAPLVKATVKIGADASLSTDVGTAAQLSPDGRTLVFAAQRTASEPSRLFVRRLDQLSASELTGTEDARAPFFSPDGQWVAFFAEGKLKKIALTGGTVVTLCDAPSARGGSWAEDGTIVFQPNIASARASLARVSASGGEPTFMKPEENGRARFPQALPGNRAVLYTWYGPDSVGEIRIELPDGERRRLFAGGHARYLPSGHALYVHESSLYGVAFDLERLQPVGQPVPLVEGIDTRDAMAAAQYSVSENGTLVYAAGADTTVETPEVSWLDVTGKVSPLLPSGRNWSSPRVSPDGTRVAFEILDDSRRDLWTYDVRRGSLDRLTFDTRATEGDPVWTPDSRRIVFRKSEPGTASNLYWLRADLTGGIERLTNSPFGQTPGSWHPSGKLFAFSQVNPETNPDIWILPMEGDEASGWKPGTPEVLLKTDATEYSPQFSPDGKWLAYVSNTSGLNEVYVRPFPGPGGPWQISSGGGNTNPIWSRAKQELFYSQMNRRQLMVASYRVEAGSFQRDPPRLWSKAQFVVRRSQRAFDLHPDGQRFVLAVAPEMPEITKRDELVFVFNFVDELRRLVPVPGR